MTKGIKQGMKEKKMRKNERKKLPVVTILERSAQHALAPIALSNHCPRTTTPTQINAIRTQPSQSIQKINTASRSKVKSQRWTNNEKENEKKGERREGRWREGGAKGRKEGKEGRKERKEGRQGAERGG